MKALYLRTDFYGAASVGGSFSHTKGFLEGLEKSGHSACVISSGPLAVPPAFKFFHVPYSSLFRNLPEVLSIAYNSRVIRHANRVIPSEKSDFIYHRHSEFNFSSSVLARKWKLPLVLEFNGSEVWVKKNWGIVYLETILRLAENIQLSSADLIAVVSQVIKDDLVRLGVDQNKIIVNPNGVDPDLFSPAVDGSAVRREHNLDGKIVAGFVGTFGAWHGVEVLARAVKTAVQRFPNVRFLVVGDGPLRGEVERILKEDRVEQFVTLTGSIGHSDIPRHLAACDLLLSPHVQNADGTVFFGSPTKLFEYMGMGKAIIASAVGQIGEIMRDGKNCLLIKPNDHDDLANKIVTLANDRTLRERLGARARMDAVEKYSWQRNAERIVNAVKPLIRKQ